MNKVILIGRLTKDIELRETQNGHKTCSFGIAVDRGKGKDGTRYTDYPNIVAWNKVAELCARYLHKGDKVGIDGSIQTRSYDKNGQRVYVTEVMANSIEFLTPKGQQNSGEPQLTDNVTQDGFSEVQDDELPFD